MSRWAFYWQMFKGAFRHGWEAAHHVHMAVILLGGLAILIVAVSLEEFMAAGVICVIAFVVFVAVGLFEHAYQTHREEHDKRSAAEKGSAALQEALDKKSADLQALLAEKESSNAVLRELLARLEAEHAQVEELNKLAGKANRLLDVREQLGRFIIEGQHLQEACDSPRSLDQNEKVREWAERVEKFLADNLGVHYVARFRSGAGLPPPHIDHSIPYRDSWDRVRTGLARLDQFLAEGSPQ
jgi:hypothetical protein